MGMWSKTYRVAWAIVVGCLVFILTGLCLTQYYKLREMQREKRASETGNRHVDSMIKENRTNQERFGSDPAFVERTAREMGMVKPDELVFKASPTNPATPPPGKTGSGKRQAGKAK